MNRRNAALLLVCALLAGCRERGGIQAASAVPVRPALPAPTAPVDSPSMQYLPRLDQAPGWRLEGDPLVYPADALRSYLDTDARHFLLYEVVDVTVGQYHRSAGNGFATVEIFRFPDFVKAFGAYSSRRDGATAFLDIPNEAFVSRDSIHVWRGPFYIRITGGGAPDSLVALQKLAHAVADPMPPAPSKPAVFAFLPATGRVANSESYMAERALGQPFFTHGFTARFNIGGVLIDALILPTANRTAAAGLLARYRSFFVTNGRLLDPVPNLGEDNFTAEDHTYGRAVAFRLDRFVIVFRSYGDRQTLIALASETDQRILGTIRKELQQIDLRKDTTTDVQEQGARPPWQR